MAVTTRVKLEGAAFLKAALIELGDEVGAKDGEQANRDGAELLQDLLIKAAPYDATQRLKTWRLKSGASRSAYYGHLRENIDVHGYRNARPGTVGHLVSTGEAFWGNFVEFGTVKMAAKPWFRPTLDANYQRVQTAQIEALHVGIDAEVRRIAATSGARGD